MKIESIKRQCYIWLCGVVVVFVAKFQNCSHQLSCNNLNWVIERYPKLCNSVSIHCFESIKKLIQWEEVFHLRFFFSATNGKTEWTPGWLTWHHPDPTTIAASGKTSSRLRTKIICKNTKCTTNQPTQWHHSNRRKKSRCQLGVCFNGKKKLLWDEKENFKLIFCHLSIRKTGLNHFESVPSYGIQLRGCTAQTDCLMIHRFQNKVFRVIIGATKFWRNKELHKNLHHPTVDKIMCSAGIHTRLQFYPTPTKITVDR